MNYIRNQYKKILENIPHIFKYNVPFTKRDLDLAVESLNKVQFSCSVVSDSLRAPWTAVCQASLSNNSQSLLKLMFIESLMPSNHLILCCLLLLPSIFPASESFPMSQFFASGGQSIGASASASVVPVNIQD